MLKKKYTQNGKETTVNRALDARVHSVFGKINHGGLKHNSLYMGLVLPSGGWQSLIVLSFCVFFVVYFISIQKLKIVGN
jgi:hypothetical protein